MSHPSNDIYNDPSAPFSQEAEEALLGSVLLNPKTFVEIQSFLQAEDFFLLRHQYIWQALERIQEREEPVDHIILAEELENMKTLDQIGGRSYLIKLMNNTGTSMYAEVYGRLVQRTAIRRQLMQAADNIRELARDEELNIEQVMGEVESTIFAVSNTASGSDEPQPIFDVMSDYYDYIETHLQNPSKKIGLPTGFRDVDNLLGGLKRGHFVIIGARPRMGKSSWALSAMCNMARQGIRTVLFSLEMTVQDIAMRIISLESGINLQRLSQVELTRQEMARFTEVIARVSSWPIFLYDRPALSASELRLHTNRLMYRYGLDAVFVDYAQLMRGDGYDRRTEMGHVSRQAKEIAKDLNIPVVMLAQLNRNLEARKDKRPILSDLKESGDFEQDTDVVMFLHRDEVYNEATEFPNQADLIVAKNRHGPTGTVSLYFERTLAKFTDASVHRVDVSGI